MVEVMQWRGERRCRWRRRRRTIWEPVPLEDGWVCRLGPFPGEVGGGSHCSLYRSEFDRRGADGGSIRRVELPILCDVR